MIPVGAVRVDRLKTMTKLERPNFIKYELVHYTQRSVWDCGVSCVLMVLPPAKRQYLIENFQQVCQEEGFGRR